MLFFSAQSSTFWGKVAFERSALERVEEEPDFNHATKDGLDGHPGFGVLFVWCGPVRVCAEEPFIEQAFEVTEHDGGCLLYTSPSPRDS